MIEPEFPATTRGADQVIRSGNRRRLRTGGTTLGSALAVSLLVALTPWQAPASQDSLQTANDPRPALSAQPRQTSGSPTASPPPVSAAAPSVRLGSLPPLRPTDGPASPSAQPTPGATRPATPHRSSPITRGTGQLAVTDLCTDDQTDAATGWCLRYTGPLSVRRRQTATLSAELCRLGSFAAGQVTFGTTQETTLQVQDGGNGSTVWAAGQGLRYGSPGRTVTVQPANCLTWKSSWDTRGPDGFLVLPGSYGVATGIEANGPFATGFTSLTVTD